MRRYWLVLVLLLLGAAPGASALAGPSRAAPHLAPAAPGSGPTVGASVFDLADALRLGETDGLSRLVRSLTAVRAPRSARPGGVVPEPRVPRTARARRVPPGTADVIQSHRRHGERLLSQATAPPDPR